LKHPTFDDAMIAIFGLLVLMLAFLCIANMLSLN
jgi:hypothetical protein